MNPIRIIKIGGSLLQRKDLLADLRAWQDLQGDLLVNVWIVGGGAAVEAIRERDRGEGLSADDAHWSSISAMDANASMLASQIPDWQMMSAPRNLLSAILCHTPHQNFMLQTKNWLIQADRQADRDPDVSPRLPPSWDVTSDSIAAWAAIQLHATELVLLKSCDVPNATTEELASLGIVDRHLPTLNLQSQTFRFICQQLPLLTKLSP